MAYEGELVKMENGRWARFQRCTIANAGHQDLLDAAESSLESYRKRGIPVQIRLNPDGKGKLSLSFEAPEAASVQ